MHAMPNKTNRLPSRSRLYLHTPYSVGHVKNRAARMSPGTTRELISEVCSYLLGRPTRSSLGFEASTHKPLKQITTVYGMAVPFPLLHKTESREPCAARAGLHTRATSADPVLSSSNVSPLVRCRFVRVINVPR